VWTSAALAGCFGVLLASDFLPNRVLGGLLALAAGAAVLADLVLLPAIAYFTGLGKPSYPADLKSLGNQSPVRGKELPLIAK
jgi:hypothetical protein